jgi:hypothetical protein
MLLPIVVNNIIFVRVLNKLLNGPNTNPKVGVVY